MLGWSHFGSLSHTHTHTHTLTVALPHASTHSLGVGAANGTTSPELLCQGTGPLRFGGPHLIPHRAHHGVVLFPVRRLQCSWGPPGVGGNGTRKMVDGPHEAVNNTFEYRTAQCQLESLEMPDVTTTVTSQQSRSASPNRTAPDHSTPYPHRPVPSLRLQPADAAADAAAAADLPVYNCYPCPPMRP
ncbi:hypothetical protein CH63R_12377 [Colletotrichum higginsianum IMI 349063]|uniref:Uncharacterized protein n=1 Tax=Colletotrichum higginsianum (strain IMI 349063) TaxID=759273 RepID=A0A1B7XU22_COLHI|nr:hypothetical protein CH63R_12377 [Colletotrichum higginsianum IMI 349063]OBR03250.1 hypothetical protein CH63R_12377 [Colletotrichum higginsianum IMI 349063]